MRLADEAWPLGPGPGRSRATSASRGSSRPRAAAARRWCTPATGSWPRTQPFAQACVDAGLTFVGPTPRRHRAHGQQDRGAGGGDRPPACRSCRARRRRSTTTASDDELARTARAGRLSAARQGGRGRRRQGHAHGGRRPTRCSPRFGPPDRKRARRSAIAPCTSSAGSGVRATSRSSCSATRTARSCRSSSASARSSGGTRRWSRSRRRWRSNQPRGSAMADCAARVAALGRLHQRRHDRVPARRARRVLLPRDEHAAAGRASGDRDGDRRRPRALAAAHRAGRAARPFRRSRR